MYTVNIKEKYHNIIIFIMDRETLREILKVQFEDAGIHNPLPEYYDIGYNLFDINNQFVPTVDYIVSVYVQSTGNQPIPNQPILNQPILNQNQLLINILNLGLDEIREAQLNQEEDDQVDEEDDDDDEEDEEDEEDDDDDDDDDDDEEIDLGSDSESDSDSNYDDKSKNNIKILKINISFDDNNNINNIDESNLEFDKIDDLEELDDNLSDNHSESGNSIKFEEKLDDNTEEKTVNEILNISSSDLKTININLEESQTENYDFKKLSLPKLRSIVIEKRLASNLDANKFKKQELLKLLGAE